MRQPWGFEKGEHSTLVCRVETDGGAVVVADTLSRVLPLDPKNLEEEAREARNHEQHQLQQQLENQQRKRQQPRAKPPSDDEFLVAPRGREALRRNPGQRARLNHTAINQDPVPEQETRDGSRYLEFAREKTGGTGRSGDKTNPYPVGGRNNARSVRRSLPIEEAEP